MERSVAVDRLSALPDEVLVRIISQLGDLKSSMRTSVLSRRWRNLWTSITNISFEWPRIKDSADQLRFANSAAAVLDRRGGAPIRRLDLRLADECSEGCQWIKRALQFNVEEVLIQSLVVHGSDYKDLGQIISECKSLRVLEMPSSVFPDLRGFSNLTCLRLINVWAFDSDFGKELESSPQLDSLTLIGCYFRAIEISHTCLKKLTMDFCEAKRAVLCAPGLLSLDLGLECDRFASFSVNDLSSLFSSSLWFEIRKKKKVAILREILRGINHAWRVKVLQLDIKSKEAREQLDLDLPTFCNLEHLEVSEEMDRDVRYILVMSILRNAEKCIVLEGAEEFTG